MLALLSLTAQVLRKRMQAMSTLTIRNVEPVIKDKLRMAAAAHGRSMEEEVRSILRTVLNQTTVSKGVGSRVHARFAALGDMDLILPDRADTPRAASLTEGETP
jgi:plasmid stability protein